MVLSLFNALKLIADFAGWFGLYLVSHVTSLKISIATTVRTALNAGSGSAQAVEFQAANDAVLASIALAATPWGAANGSGTIAASITAPGTATVGTSGTATKGRVKDKDGNVVITFGVGTSGQDVNFDAVVWTQNGSISLSSLTYTPA